MSVSIRAATRGTAAGALATPDQEWRGLVTEAALAAGVSRSGRASTSASVADQGLTAADPEAPGNHLIRAIRQYSPEVALDVTGRHLSPSAALEAELEGELLDAATVYKSSSTVDIESGEIRMTCQTGQFSAHDAARSSFPPEHRCAFGTFNVAEAGVVASVPVHEVAGSEAGTVSATLVVPVAFDNTLQRIWRLAVPSADMLIDARTPHFAVVGVRGAITLMVEGAGHPPVSSRREIVRRSLSAHAPSQPVGFGPVRGPHVVKAVVPDIDPGRDLTVSVTVSLMTLVAGDAANYRPGAPFYAGIDFGGNGSVRLPHECLSAFEIPLTPLIGNHPITLSDIAFAGHSNGYAR